MADSEMKETLSKLAHDIRGPIHTAKLNLDAAQMLAARVRGKNGERLATHLQIVQSELAKLSKLVVDFSAKLR